MENVKVTLVKSLIGCKKNQIATAKTLGLTKIGDLLHQCNSCFYQLLHMDCHYEE